MGVIVFLLVAVVVLAVLASLVSGIVSLAVQLLMWGIIGWLAGQIMRGRGYGAVYNILLGFGGGIVGGIIFRILPLSGLGDLWLIGSVLSGVVGAVALIYIVRLFSQNKQFGS